MRSGAEDRMDEIEIPKTGDFYDKVAEVSSLVITELYYRGCESEELTDVPDAVLDLMRGKVPKKEIACKAGRFVLRIQNSKIKIEEAR